MNRKFFATPFDEGTLIKLELFRRYLRSWLPVFIEQKYSVIEIADFFSGIGLDSSGALGSPLIILDELRIYCKKIKQYGGKVRLTLNDNSGPIIDALKKNIDDKISICLKNQSHNLCNGRSISECPFEISVHNEDFNILFEQKFNQFLSRTNVPRFIFLDQFGIKYVTKDVFQKLICLKKTDFMFFISSHHLVRFKDQPEFQKYLEISNLDFSSKKPSECHRVIYNYYKSILGTNNGYLGQFSIKKGANYYGIIFYSNSPVGLAKFLDAAWTIDPHTGETNHDIDNDPIRQGQMTIDLFSDGNQNRVKKLVYFELRLLEFLVTPKSNKNLYIFAIENGISIPKTNEILRNLEKKKLIVVVNDPRPRRGVFYLDFNSKKNILICNNENNKN